MDEDGFSDDVDEIDAPDVRERSFAHSRKDTPKKTGVANPVRFIGKGLSSFVVNRETGKLSPVIPSTAPPERPNKGGGSSKRSYQHKESRTSSSREPIGGSPVSRKQKEAVVPRTRSVTHHVSPGISIVSPLASRLTSNPREQKSSDSEDAEDMYEGDAPSSSLSADRDHIVLGNLPLHSVPRQQQLTSPLAKRIAQLNKHPFGSKHTQQWSFYNQTSIEEEIVRISPVHDVVDSTEGDDEPTLFEPSVLKMESSFANANSTGRGGTEMGLRAGLTRLSLKVRYTTNDHLSYWDASKLIRGVSLCINNNVFLTWDYDVASFLIHRHVMNDHVTPLQSHETMDTFYPLPVPIQQPKAASMQEDDDDKEDMEYTVLIPLPIPALMQRPALPIHFSETGQSNLTVVIRWKPQRTTGAYHVGTVAQLQQGQDLNDDVIEATVSHLALGAQLVYDLIVFPYTAPVPQLTARSERGERGEKQEKAPQFIQWPWVKRYSLEDKGQWNLDRNVTSRVTIQAHPSTTLGLGLFVVLTCPNTSVSLDQCTFDMKLMDTSSPKGKDECILSCQSTETQRILELSSIKYGLYKADPLQIQSGSIVLAFPFSSHFASVPTPPVLPLQQTRLDIQCKPPLHWSTDNRSKAALIGVKVQVFYAAMHVCAVQDEKWTLVTV